MSESLTAACVNVSLCSKGVWMYLSSTPCIISLNRSSTSSTVLARDSVSSISAHELPNSTSSGVMFHLRVSAILLKCTCDHATSWLKILQRFFSQFLRSLCSSFSPIQGTAAMSTAATPQGTSSCVQPHPSASSQTSLGLRPPPWPDKHLATFMLGRWRHLLYRFIWSTQSGPDRSSPRTACCHSACLYRRLQLLEHHTGVGCRLTVFITSEEHKHVQDNGSQLRKRAFNILHKIAEGYCNFTKLPWAS